MSFRDRDPKTDAIRQAVDAELKREPPDRFMSEVRALQARIAARGRSGLAADKAFFDWLSGEDDD